MEHRKLRTPQEKKMGQKGQAIEDYTLILVFIALACVAAVTLFGRTVLGLYNGFNGSF